NLFREPVGAPMRLDAVNDLVAAASRRAGLAEVVTPHQLRHAFGSNVADADVGLDVVQELLGHASICSTQVYVHPDEARLRVAEIADLPQLPPLPDRPAGCAVPGCLRMSPGPRSRLCQPHSRRLRRTAGMSIEVFLADPRVRPLSALGPCNVAACVRNAESEH